MILDETVASGPRRGELFRGVSPLKIEMEGEVMDPRIDLLMFASTGSEYDDLLAHDLFLDGECVTEGNDQNA